MTSLYNRSQRNQLRHDFLLTFFSSEEKYQTKELNGYMLVKQWNNNIKRWELAIFTKDSFKRRETYLQSLPGNLPGLR